CVRGAIFDLW
nr:immunoglobulin heavy chain junction region [Macaca mulatta]MOW87195.1 immunoglobulin heavy chain junction region [Macaca mulatta]MOW87774.1 immunoglobulin heavy chain junction region [Macaca mulatta]MOW88219.1 immunoglobulin heavy chain junction region [Macaca mulatta]MOW88445.1 immunoglobulin heavy chain junction region [Macaca mulatta]